MTRIWTMIDTQERTPTFKLQVDGTELTYLLTGK